MTQSFIIHRPIGSGWKVGTPLRQQPLWDEHAAFMTKLFSEGKIVLGGLYADASGAMVIVEVEDEEAAQHVFDDDPWIVHGILRPGQVKAWTILLDARTKNT